MHPSTQIDARAGCTKGSYTSGHIINSNKIVDEMPMISSLRKHRLRSGKFTGRELARILELKAGLHNSARNGQSVQNSLKLPSEANFSSRRCLRSRRGLRELRRGILELCKAMLEQQFTAVPRQALRSPEKTALVRRIPRRTISAPGCVHRIWSSTEEGQRLSSGGRATGGVLEVHRILGVKPSPASRYWSENLTSPYVGRSSG